MSQNLQWLWEPYQTTTHRQDEVAQQILMGLHDVSMATWSSYAPIRQQRHNCHWYYCAFLLISRWRTRTFLCPCLTIRVQEIGLCTRRLASNLNVTAGNLCDELKRRLLRTPRLNFLGTYSSVVLRGTLNAVELHVDTDTAPCLETSLCLRDALVLLSLARSAGNGKCGAVLLSLVCPVFLVHRTDQSVLSEIPTLTSMWQSLNHN